MSTKPSKEDPVLHGKERFFEDEVHDALRLKGWVLPQSEEEVRLAENSLTDIDTTIPPELANPFAVFEKVKSPPSAFRQLGLGESGEFEENLARAAREGGQLSPEIEEKMRQDREKVEEEEEED